jgi:hypothetical protein
MKLRGREKIIWFLPQNYLVNEPLYAVNTEG